ncbi:hypothetical protein SISNIDRAFT_474934 [Sistotremastrum niveocremeum HHB9708]|uniref:AAAP amino acid permease n=1 Tax=Sistotremastrum niveocremeum HHB9708 TaxID=1314777 RepID=A0A164T1S0_9AGAM|nr:hypothetical protein SISNIDRAFT_474934 [Sistotremastrum niveocremeum HHB9708]
MRSPPSFAESQLDVILRRQRHRPLQGGGLKFTNTPTRFLNLSSDWEFAGWGSTLYLELTPEEFTNSDVDISARQVLGQYTASAVAGNAVLGSVFYALPAVVALAGVFSPISLFIATLVLFFWRPVMEELAETFPLVGSNYTYLLNVSSKSIALGGAAITLLDAAMTVVVSSGTASAYLSSEVHPPFPAFVLVIIFLLGFAILCLSGTRDSARMAFGILSFHILTMIILMIFASISWARRGNAQISSNWHSGDQASPAGMFYQIFKGICIGFLGLSGFECTPADVPSIRSGRFPSVLRNIHLATIVLNGPLMLLVLALIPMDTILSGANVLSILAQEASGRWLRTWLVVDALLVLCGGMFTGILSACAVLEKLALDRVLPPLFLKRMPVTGSPYFSILCFTCLCGVIYATTGANLTVSSQMFALSFLAVMSLYPISNLLMKFNRGRLVKSRNATLLLVFSTIILSLILLIGNIIINPITLAYFSAYTLAILAVFIIGQNKIHIIRWLYWVYDQAPLLHHFRWSKGWGAWMIDRVRSMKQNTVCVMIKTDEIHQMFRMIRYVRENEETSCLKLIHFYNRIEDVPSELEANQKILDEMFPELTIDLVFVQAPFTPATVCSVSKRLVIPRSLMFISCPGPEFPYSIADLGGVRIITL